MIRTPRTFIEDLSRHRDCRESTLRLASGLTAEELDTATDPKVIRIRRMVRDVMNEKHLLSGFVRLEPLGDSILYGYMSPRHDVGHPVCARLARRFPGSAIILGDNSRSWLALLKGGRTLFSKAGPLMRVVSELSFALNETPSGVAGKLWETYYWSQYCDERRNLQLYEKWMPHAYRKSAGLRVESNTNRASLDDF